MGWRSWNLCIGRSMVGNAESVHKFGFDGPKLDGCGAQTDMQLWDGVLKADGGPPVMVECR